MSAIITDQIRILNAKNFVAGVSTNTNSYYAFVGLPNPTGIRTDWDTSQISCFLVLWDLFDVQKCVFFEVSGTVWSFSPCPSFSNF